MALVVQGLWMLLSFILIDLAADINTDGMRLFSWQRLVRSGLIVLALNLFAAKALR